MPDEPPRTRLRLHAVVRGDVQGVGYRYFARREAQALGLVGFVRNLADGSVEIVAEGERSHLEALVVALQRGPTAAQVEQVDCKWGAPEGRESAFLIRY
jgi:acylphosphatase